MKFLDQVKIYIKAGNVVMAHQASEEKSMLSTEVLMVVMVVKVDQ